jgi:hypothetical protein
VGVAGRAGGSGHITSKRERREKLPLLGDATLAAVLAQLGERLFEQLVTFGHGASHHEELERGLRRTACHPLARRWLVLDRTGRLAAHLAGPGLGQLDVKREGRARLVPGMTPVGDLTTGFDYSTAVNF